MPGESILTFAFRRFRRDLGTGVQRALRHPTPIPVVILATHTEHMDPETMSMVPKALVDKQTKKAVLPAIAIVDIRVMKHNVDYSAAKIYLATTMEDPVDGQLYPGTEIWRGPLILTAVFGLRLYANDQVFLQEMHLATQRYLELHPYLLIPHDRSNADADMGQNVEELIYQYQNESRFTEKRGVVIEQRSRSDNPFGEFQSNSNTDNLFMSTTTAELANMPFQLDGSLGKYINIRQMIIELYDKDDPTEEVKATIEIVPGEEEP
jgi:hypothetical protein